MKRSISNSSKQTEDEVTSSYFKLPKIRSSAAEGMGKTVDVGNTKQLCRSTRLKEEFFDVQCEDLAKNLIGKILVRMIDNVVLKGRIVETECYLGGLDKASHSYNGRVTERNKPMFMKPGTSYVYFTYGMYHCFNISSKGDGAAVLLRSLEPIEGVSYMYSQRMNFRKSKNESNSGEATEKSEKPKAIKLHELCNGPGKLCVSMNIDRHKCNMKDLCQWEEMWLEEDDISTKIFEMQHIVRTKRIGINSVAEEWANKPLRFYLFGNKSVSRVDKAKEKELIETTKPLLNT